MRFRTQTLLFSGLAYLAIVVPLTLSAATRPNVVLVITDDQGYGDVGVHGNSMIQTPHIDRLFAESVRLSNFHVDPTCSPTRSALLSGRYSTRTGVWHTIMGRSLMSEREVTIAETFRANGYRTGMFGKWHLGENHPCRPQDQGFDEAFYHGGGGIGQGPDYWGNDYFDDTYFRLGKPEQVDGYCTDVWFANALDFIERHKDGDQPFFCYLSTNAPHGPYLVDEKYSQPYRDRGVAATMARFYGMITNIDENLGRLRAALRSWELQHNTVLIFMTDNGSAAGWRVRGNETARWRGFNAGMRGGKGSEYDGGHRVPCFVHWPAGDLKGGRDVDQLTAHVDLLPTLVDLCDLQKPPGPGGDGASLKAVLAGDREALRDRTLFVHSQRLPDPKKWRKSAVMTERWRFINGRELYDLQADPGQRKDVAAQHPQTVAELTRAYEQWWESLKPAFGQPVRIHLGSRAEPVVQLHPHDWHVTGQAQSPWHQGHVRSGHMGNGHWEVDVRRQTRYRVELRRWPRHLNQSIEATAARIRVGDRELHRAIPADATHVVFELELAPGPAQLQTWLTLADGKQRGAFFVYVSESE
ncbi:MAG: N-acetylgalactosamine 6-sulfate sulfatase [Planctomycetaceae bacterium]|nr:N-acetylgalactosamine 6-sulfate sulfatase [Planctomycetaceae bacterium]